MSVVFKIYVFQSQISCYEGQIFGDNDSVAAAGHAEFSLAGKPGQRGTTDRHCSHVSRTHRKDLACKWEFGSARRSHWALCR